MTTRAPPLQNLHPVLDSYCIESLSLIRAGSLAYGTDYFILLFSILSVNSQDSSLLAFQKQTFAILDQLNPTPCKHKVSIFPLTRPAPA